MRSRFAGSGIGANVFSSTDTTCPPGQHYVAPAATAVRGLGDCVPNAIAIKPLTFHATSPAPAAAPPAAAAPPVSVRPLDFQTPAPAATPSAPDVTRAAAPAADCPPVWPWWWLVVAAGAGGALGYYVQKNQKAVKKNAGRMAGHAAGRIVNRASEAAIARLVG